MSNVINATVPAEYNSPLTQASFIAAYGTAAKIVLEPQSAVVAGATSPMKWGGATAIDITVASTDSAAKDMKVWSGDLVTTQDPGNTGTLSTTTSTLVRAVGSWITDKVKVGMAIMLFAPSNLADNTSIDGIPCIVTGVTATTLTFNGTPIAVSAGLAAGTRVVAVTQKFVIAIPANAGNNNATANVSLLDAATDSSKIRTQLKMGLTDFVIANMTAAVSALPAVISVTPTIAKY